MAAANHKNGDSHHPHANGDAAHVAVGIAGAAATGVRTGLGGLAPSSGPKAKIPIASAPATAFKLTQNELDRITEVFKMYEADPTEATMYPKDLAVAMKKLGLNPTETEIQDLINEVEINGVIFYQDFSRVIVRKMREDDEENFYQEMFRTLVGPQQLPTGTSTAQPYNFDRQRLSLEQFNLVMSALPIHDADLPKESEVREMFGTADKDGNGRITYNEFRRMCVVPKLALIPDAPGPVVTDSDLYGEGGHEEHV